MSKKTKVILITVISVIVALCLGTAAYIAVVNLNKSPVYLDKEITADVNNLEQFVTDTSNEYFADKTVTFYIGTEKVTIPITDFASVDVEKTVNKIKTELFQRNAVSFNTQQVFPEFEINSDTARAALFDFAFCNNTGSSFFAPDEQYKTVSIDLTKPIVDIDATIDAALSNITKLDFSNVEMLHSNDFEAEYIASIVNKKPRDAELKIEGENTVISKEQVGYTVDKEQLANAIASGETKFTVEIVEIIKPEVTEQLLMDKQLFGDVLSSCSSYYNANVAGRARNVELAASKINGLVMQPGDVFSYNGVVGPRTYANGFKDAGVYTANGLESGVGGGICQVSSTLYGAQLMADLKTVTRTNHSYTIGYLPSGQDATVSYGAIDYKFENNKHFPIKIECIASGGLLKVSILGIKTDSYREIKLNNQIIETRDFSTVTKEVDTLQPGEQKITQSGQRGMTVNTYKIYYNNGIEEKREFVHKSTYIPMPQIVEQGKSAEESVPADAEIVVEEPEFWRFSE